MSFIFYGESCQTSSDPSGSVGVVMNGRNLLNSTFEVGRRIASAGQEGLSIDVITRTDLGELERAGVLIRSNSIGSRVSIDRFPEPSSYIVPQPKPPQRRTGQYGAPSVQRAPTRSCVDYDRIKPTNWR